GQPDKYHALPAFIHQFAAQMELLKNLNRQFCETHEVQTEWSGYLFETAIGLLVEDGRTMMEENRKLRSDLDKFRKVDAASSRSIDSESFVW
ncbi:hypothetical protein PFISCL1PPCAC_9424, partial [Pristionchus fissidentatus]